MEDFPLLVVSYVFVRLLEVGLTGKEGQHLKSEYGSWTKVLNLFQVLNHASNIVSTYKRKDGKTFLPSKMLLRPDSVLVQIQIHCRQKLSVHRGKHNQHSFSVEGIYDSEIICTVQSSFTCERVGWSRSNSETWLGFTEWMHPKKPKCCLCCFDKSNHDKTIKMMKFLQDKLYSFHWDCAIFYGIAIKF